VNGVFVMDTAQTSSERLLARAVLADDGPDRLLVGGLGIGFTVRELLADPRVRQVVVAEIEPAVVGWMSDGTLPGADLLADPRVDVRITDVRDAVASSADASYAGVLLDIDNGPGYLVHDANVAVYRENFLRDCRRVLRDGGRLTVWSAAPAPELAATLGQVFGTVTSRPVDVDLQGRAEQYWLLSAVR
ncbi:MAG: hypothetical protein GEU96_10120, partial [Propionibacteriales bacterium]|nr:hypothetical protein [Propionibacteriales bacterium]